MVGFHAMVEGIITVEMNVADQGNRSGNKNFSIPPYHSTTITSVSQPCKSFQQIINTIPQIILSSLCIIEESNSKIALVL